MVSRRALWFVLWASFAGCVGGPISDLPHSGDDESSPMPPRGHADAGSASIDAGKGGGEPTSGPTPDGGDGQGVDGGYDGGTLPAGDASVELGPDGEPCIDPDLL